MTRRGLLTRIGAVAGAGAMYGSMDALGVIAGPLSAPAAHAADQDAWRPPKEAIRGPGHGVSGRVIGSGRRRPRSVSGRRRHPAAGDHASSVS